jgi:superfamily I DNA/RNA helicase
LGELKKADDIEDDIRLTYVAITRATHEAFITYSNMSELVGRLVVQIIRRSCHRLFLTTRLE